ncbi:lipase secretion chaperone [Iodobacter sp.]|uniref:lipase secretion chaperone n=1 Tax=Iodobacter sp. TaxID=1915058 RepID=UPI0026009F05|nr:lipase secretion chaperone [Iodobacter sp.]
MLRWIFAAMAATVILVAAAAWSLKPAPAAAPVAAIQAKPNFAPSLFGTLPDGDIEPAKGELQLNQALLRRFDYYLATVGERSLSDIMAQIGQDLDRELKPVAAKEAKRILAQYIQFKRALSELANNPAIAGQSIATMRLRLAAIQNTRSRFFNRAEIAALFADEDQQDELLLDRLVINQDTQLNATQKAQKQAALDAKLSPAEQQARAGLIAHLSLAANIQSAKSQGATANQLHALRSASVGEQAADRLAALDQEENQWQAKIDRYLIAKANAIHALPNTEQNTAIQKLRDANFSPLEQKRLGAFE